MHNSHSEYQLLAHAITALRTPRFTSCLMTLLHESLSFDCAVILGHRAGKHPIYLYDSIPERRELLFQHYLTNAYLTDPFYLELIAQGKKGVFSLNNIARSSPAFSEYHRAFYQKTGWQDELCLTIQITSERWVVIYLGNLSAGQSFSEVQIDTLKQRFDVFAALCRQHWEPSPFHLAQPSSDNSQVGHAILQAVASFGATHLSPREQQVTSLLLQGLDSEEIAESLGITLGTVKNHRKRIYAQLQVSSLSELFRLFLNDLIAASRLD